MTLEASEEDDNEHMHLSICTLHFFHMEVAVIYKLRVQDCTIRVLNVTMCETSLFTFDAGARE